jgi:photosystem II stability/assembly factor-like uncharacterized protein
MLATVIGVGCLAGAEAGVGTWTSGGPETGSIRGIAIDPQTPGVVYVLAGNGVLKSTSGGELWSPINDGLDLRGSVSALALDPQAPATLYAATGRGVSKSTDGGARWNPNDFLPSFVVGVIALAVDPRTAGTVYAGAYTVFKSIDGGATWVPSGTGLPPQLGTNGSATVVDALVIDPVTPSTLYASIEGDVFKSINGGASWSAINNGLLKASTCDVRCPSAVLAIDPTNPDTVYAGEYLTGVFKTTNGGVSWSPINTGLSNLRVSGIAIDPRTPTVLYVGTDIGVFKSTTGGASWNLSNSGRVVDTAILAVDPLMTARIYAGGAASGVFRSDDGAANWSASNTGIRFAVVHSVTVDPLTPSIIYATGHSSIFKSTDGAVSWRLSDSGAGPDIRTMVIDPKNPNILYVVVEGFDDAHEGPFTKLLKSIDSGTTWNPATNGPIERDLITSLAIDPQTPTTLYAGATPSGPPPVRCFTCNRVYKSQDGGATWIVQFLPTFPLSFDPIITIDPQTPTTVYAATVELFKSTDAGVTWNMISRESLGQIVVDPNVSTTLYAIARPIFTAARGIIKSVDGGITFTSSNSGLPGSVVGSLVIDPQVPSTLYAAVSGQGVFKSVDSGGSWSAMNDGLGSLSAGSLAINSAGTCLHVGTDIGVFDFATQADPDCTPPASLAASVLPFGRSVPVGTPATAFVTVVNTSTFGRAARAPSGGVQSATAGPLGIKCGITQITGVPTPFSFQATDPATNQIVGLPNTPVDIPPGSGQSFVISLETPTPVASTDIQFGFNCTNTDRAPTIVGVNTLRLTVSATPGPDIIALAATSTRDGIVNVPGATGTGAFAVATTNAGASASITVSVDTGSATLPMNAVLCQTNPANAQCVSPLGPTVTVTINAGETPTFSVFVIGAGNVPFDPANNRIFVRFTDGSGVTAGATSVAVRTQ